MTRIQTAWAEMQTVGAIGANRGKIGQTGQTWGADTRQEGANVRAPRVSTAWSSLCLIDIDALGDVRHWEGIDIVVESGKLQAV